MDLILNNATPKKNLVLYFQVHQPRRLRNFKFFDIGSGNPCFDEELDREVVQRVARECYLPTNELLLKVIRKHPQVKVTFSLSGIIIDQLEEYAPEVLHSFKQLAATGNIEFLSETCQHSLACMIPGKEFEAQILRHAEKIYEHFGARPAVFRNTELIYSDEIGRRISKLGFTGVLADGVESILGGRSANYIYQHPDQEHLRILLRNYRLSDEIGFRFIDQGRTLTAETYMEWLQEVPKNHDVITLGMDYETFGEHLKKETGILRFLEDLLVRVAKSKAFDMATASMAMISHKAKDGLSVPNFISWADQERDLSAWLGNEMQRDAFDSLSQLEVDVKNLGDDKILSQWRELQTSDHFYYMSTKKGSDGNVHSYFSPFPSPYEAFITYMNVLTDFSMRIKILTAGSPDKVTSIMGVRDFALQTTGSRMTMLSVR